MIASAAGYTWKKSYAGSADEETKNLRNLVLPGVIEDSIWPDFNNMDLDKPKAFANTIVLTELVDRSVKKENLCEGMFDVFQAAVCLHPEFLARTAAKRKKR